MRRAGSTKSKVNFVLDVQSNNTYRLSIRSSSVIFVPAESLQGGIPSTSGALDLANPYLGGFGFSRPEAGIKRESGTRDRPKASMRTDAPGNITASIRTDAPGNITLDSYHHARKRRRPGMRFLQAFDLYSYVRYPLLYLIILTHRRQHKSTNNIAPNSAASRQGIC